MITWIEIGGEERPIHFSNRLAYEYELATRRKYIPDVRELFSELAAAGAAAGTDQVEQVAGDVSVVILSDLVFCALKYAHRKERVPLNFEPADVADWLLSDTETIARVFQVLGDSFPKPEADSDDDAKKKEMLPAQNQTAKKRPTTAR